MCKDKKPKDLFNPTFEEEYELALRIGNERFGPPCKHEKTKNGYCLKCLRKVIDKLPR